MSNIAKVYVTIEGTRPLLQRRFGEDAIPLEKNERTGVAGNDPHEWEKTSMVDDKGQLYVLGTYIFGMMKEAAKFTKKGKGSIQAMVAATLQIEEQVILLNRHLPNLKDLKKNAYKEPVYIDVCGVVNPSSKGRNIRYRLACSPGWQCSFTLLWDKTIVSREQMRAVVHDASLLVGLADGRKVGNGRFKVLSWEELSDAEETATPRSVANPATDRVEKGRRKVHPVPEAVSVNGVSD